MPKSIKNKDNKKEIKKYIDLLYMTSAEVTAKDIATLFKDEADLKIELWEEMNVLEIELSSGYSVDFEPLDVNFKDPSDAAFVKNRNIHTIFALELVEDDYELIKASLELVVNRYSGFICADSPDFKPVYIGTTKI